MLMPFCKKCRFELDDDAEFCPKCGTPNQLSTSKDIPSGTIGSDDGDYGQKTAQSSGTINGNNQGGYGFDLSHLPKDFKIENRYRIEKKLGRGGFGTVYKAWDNNTDCWKALKVIDNIFYDDKRVIADLKHETKLLMGLNSRYVVRIWDIHLSGEIRFIDMEYIEGGDLEDLLLTFPNRKIPEDKVTKLIKQISKGMADIHKHRIIHKDLKPQNIMLTKSGNIKIMDFGISETFRSSKSRLKESSKSGTPVYMSPEHLLGKDVGKESDIWSFGVMIYELLSGKQLYSGQSYSDVLMQIERKKFESLSGISDKINFLIKKCLQYDYKDRFRNFEKITEYLKKDFEIEKKEKLKAEKEKTEKENFEYFSSEEYKQERKQKEEQQRLAKIESDKIEKSKNTKKIEEKKSPKPRFKNTIIWIFVIILLITSFLIFQKINLQSIKSTEMVFVKGGTFQMGSTSGDSDEKPIHSVTVSGFYIENVEVTQKEWKEIMGNNPSKRKGDNKPVEQVSWFDAVEFCNKKSKKEGLTPCYTGSGKNTKCNFSANGYRLPTEAEWEFSARGGNWSNGYKYSGSNDIGSVAWYSSNSRRKTHSVGGKKANELGIYDMSGNVYEWCNDWKGSYNSSSQTNPKGASSGSRRVSRGGGWSSYAENCRVASRTDGTPGNGSSNLGFRLSRSSK